MAKSGTPSKSTKGTPKKAVTPRKSTTPSKKKQNVTPKKTATPKKAVTPSKKRQDVTPRKRKNKEELEAEKDDRKRKLQELESDSSEESGSDSGSEEEEEEGNALLKKLAKEDEEMSSSSDDGDYVDDDSSSSSSDEEVDDDDESDSDDSEEDEEEDSSSSSSSDDDDEKEEENAKKRRRTEKESKPEQERGKIQKTKFVVQVDNVSPSFAEQHIEEALRDNDLPFVAVEKYAYNAARVFVASQEDAEKFVSKRTLKSRKTTLVFSVDKDEKDQIMILGLSPEITEDVLMPYMKDIAQENDDASVEQIIIFPTLQSQGATAAYVKFSGPVPKAIEFNRAKIQGKPIEISFVTEKDRRVNLRGVNKTVSESELIEYMQDAGEVDYAYIVTNNEGEHMQRAVVCFKDMQGTRNILDYNGADIHGKPVRINLQRDGESLEGRIRKNHKRRARQMMR